MAEVELLKEIKEMKEDIDYLKQHMVDADSIMTEEDYEALLAYRKEKAEGTLTSHEDLKKELSL